MRWFRLRKRKEAEIGTPRVSLYTLSPCPSCDKAEKFFAERHIPFHSTNYDLADEATQEKIINEIAGDELQAFPLVHIGDQTVQGYDPKLYAKLLGINS